MPGYWRGESGRKSNIGFSRSNVVSAVEHWTSSTPSSGTRGFMGVCPTSLHVLWMKQKTTSPKLVKYCSLNNKYWSGQMAAHTEPGSTGSFLLLKGSFPFHCHYMLIQEE
ncbi:hypothetical protein CRENBAI_009348 [Crenichthys baileyi]|uniref:Uncharacterized protein n=1 Tax=Crenichthys baileyi TaxID=28760 RepID=A0AAV9SC50_9TELE